MNRSAFVVIGFDKSGAVAYRSRPFYSRDWALNALEQNRAIWSDYAYKIDIVEVELEDEKPPADLPWFARKATRRR